MEWDYKIKKDFKSFLFRTGLVHKDKIKYYVYWINKFLYFSRYRPNKPVSQNIPSYLEKQAEDAILIYVEKFMNERKISINLTTNAQKEKQGNSNPDQQSSTWEYVLSQFHKNILLRHYSPRTEKSYRIWINRFCGFMKNCDPYSLKSKDVKAFLSHLATQEKVSASFLLVTLILMWALKPVCLQI